MQSKKIKDLISFKIKRVNITVVYKSLRSPRNFSLNFTKKQFCCIYTKVYLVKTLQ